MMMKIMKKKNKIKDRNINYLSLPPSLPPSLLKKKKKKENKEGRKKWVHGQPSPYRKLKVERKMEIQTDVCIV